jgi:hypothetical protein
MYEMQPQKRSSLYFLWNLLFRISAVTAFGALPIELERRSRLAEMLVSLKVEIYVRNEYSR